jgi:hypothetical protein
MSDNAGAGPTAPNKEPANPGSKSPRKRPVALSQGSGIVQQVLNFIKEMSAGTVLQRKIIVFLTMGLPTMIFALAFIFILRQQISPLWVGGATFLSGGTAAVAVARGKQRRSKTAPEQPGD